MQSTFGNYANKVPCHSVLPPLRETIPPLGSLIHNLAKNPYIQDKIVEEIKEKIESNGNLNYEAISQLDYVEACINENLRINGPFTNIPRTCVNDCIVKYGNSGGKVEDKDMVNWLSR